MTTFLLLLAGFVLGVAAMVLLNWIMNQIAFRDFWGP